MPFLIIVPTIPLRVVVMLKISQILFGIFSFGFALYGLISKNYEHNGIIFLFLSFMMLVIGIQEIQQNKNQAAIISILLFVLVFLASILSFISIQSL